MAEIVHSLQAVGSLVVGLIVAAAFAYCVFWLIWVYFSSEIA